MAGYVYLIKMFVSNDQDIFKFGRTKRKFMDRLNEYPKEAQPKIELVLWHEDIQTFEIEVLREFRKVFRERKDLGYEYFQGDVERMKQLIVGHYVPSVITNDVKDMLRMLVEKHITLEVKVTTINNLIEMFNYDVIKKDILDYLDSCTLISDYIEDHVNITYYKEQLDNLENYVDELKDIIDETASSGEVNVIKMQMKELEEQLNALQETYNSDDCSMTSSSIPNSSCNDTEQTTLTADNLVQEAIAFHKQHSLTSTDLIETIQEMLDSKIYILSEDFTKFKVDFDEANTLFLCAIAPKTIKKDALQRLLFKSVTYEDL